MPAREKTSELVEAARNGDAEAVELLISNGADVDGADGNGRTGLLRAAARGHVDVVRVLIVSGANVNAVDDDGRSALIMAARKNRLDVVKHLVDSGAAVDATDEDGRTALMCAASRGYLLVARCLVDHGAQVNTADYNARTALMRAAGHGHTQMVQYLVELGADVNAGSDGQTALMEATRNGHLGVMKCLVAYGADLNGADNDGRTVLMRAGHLDVAQYLIDCGADANAVDSDHRTAMMWAAMSGHLDVVKFLIDLGTDANAIDNDGRTALTFAATCGDEDIMKVLIACGADVNVGAIAGRPVLLGAATDGRLDIVKLAIEHGAEVNAVANDGATALMGASANGHLDIMKYLIGCNAQMDASADDGRTALIAAAISNQLDAVKYLVELGADISVSDSKGWTALTWAAKFGRMDTVKYLIGRGADVNAAGKNADSNDGRTALMVVAVSNHLDILQYLVECGADVNAVSNDGTTALMIAADVGELDNVRFLVACGADVNAANSSRRTALMEAAERGHLATARFLIENGADIRATNADGDMAIALAARHGHLNIHGMLAHYASRSIESTFSSKSTTTSGIASAFPELLVSPLDLSVKRVAEAEKIGSDFVATWLDADVAIKLFIPDAANTAFIDEVKLWHQLRHPHVIKLYGACDAGHYLFVCELAGNGSVIDYLESSPAETRRPWKYLHQAALGLAYLHERGIIHGDLRGSNILIGSDGQAKLANFGFSASKSRDRETTTSSRGFVGSLRWQSPELLKGGKPSRESDVYALGLCIVEVLSGKVPWHKDEDEWVRWRKNDWEPEKNVNFSSPTTISKECSALVKSLCCKDPARRETVATCVRMLLELARQEEARQSSICSEQEQLVDVTDHKYGELANLWTKLQGTMSDGSLSEDYSSFFKNLGDLYDAFQAIPRSPSLVKQMNSLLRNTVSMVENSSQLPTLVLRLSSTRATTTSVYQLRHQLHMLQRQLGLHQDQQASSDGTETRTQEVQMFISEISKTWMILQELETTEERLAFLSYLHSEINQHSIKYSSGQLAVMEQAYRDIKSKVDANEAISTEVPVWFVPWYELAHDGLEQIGGGGFGSVYLAKWLDSEVVVKRLLATEDAEKPSSSVWSDFQSVTRSTSDASQVVQTTRSDERRMFEHEVDIWFNLSHPHVVRLFGACHVGREPFFVCEYAPNGSLDKYLLKYPDEIWKKLHEAALGLLYLHEGGIVHCDLKCNNIVVGSDKKAKVTDFGLSLAESINSEKDNAGGNKNITGAWHWVAPELMLGDTAMPTRESDVFSFGMCLVEALRVVAAARVVDPDERENLPPCVPWELLDKEAAKYYVRRKQLPSRPDGCTDAQWELVEKMCRFTPSERIQMCVVVDELAELAIVHPPQQSAREPEPELSALVSCAKRFMVHPRSKTDASMPRNAIYQLHDMLWIRIEDLQTRFDGDQAPARRLARFAVDAQSSLEGICRHSDSLVDFTELALQAYGLHRRLDKLMAAAFVRVDEKDVTAMGVHDWKRASYALLGVGSALAEKLLSSSVRLGVATRAA